MSELTEARAQLDDARREKTELDDLIAGLERQVVDGESEEAEQRLGEQYSLERLARMRQQAAQKRVERAEALELQERRQAAVQAAREELGALAPERLAEACEEALEVIDRVCRLGDARQAAIVRHAQAFVDLGMKGHIRHQDHSWVAFEVDGVKFDNRQDCYGGRALLAAIEGERHRRTLIPARRAKGFTAPEPSSHPMAKLLAANADAAENGEVA